MKNYYVPWQGYSLYEREEEYIPVTTAVFDKRNWNPTKLQTFRANIKKCMEVYNHALHWAFKQLLYTWNGKKYECKGLKKRLQQKYNIKSRVADTIIRETTKILTAQMELKKTELDGTLLKIESLTKEIEELKEKKAKLHKLTDWFKPTPGSVKEYREIKIKLAAKKKVLNRSLCTKAKLERQIQSGVFSICFGSKDLFRQQFNIGHPNNPFPSHEAWKKEWYRQRNKTYMAIGTGKENFSNSMVQLIPDRQSYFFTVRISSPFADEKGCFFEYPVEIRYLNKELKETQRLRLPLTVTIKEEENGRLYLKVALHKQLQPASVIIRRGTIGLDFNDGFISIACIDKYGRLMATENIDIPNTLSSSKNQAILEQKIVAIHKYANHNNLSVCIEYLNFSKKKSLTASGKAKAYNRMIHRLAYSKYLEYNTKASNNYNTNLVLVSSAYTSKLGEKKYQKKLNLKTVHESAAYVIARRGSGFYEVYTKKERKL